MLHYALSIQLACGMPCLENIPSKDVLYPRHLYMSSLKTYVFDCLPFILHSRNVIFSSSLVYLLVV